MIYKHQKQESKYETPGFGIGNINTYERMKKIVDETKYCQNSGQIESTN